MKRFIITLTLLAAVASCKDGIEPLPQIEEVDASTLGYISFSNMEIIVDNSSETLTASSTQSTSTKSTAAATASIAVDDYRIRVICNGDGETLYDGDFNSLQYEELIAVSSGVYNVEAWCGGTTDQPSWDSPTYGARHSIAVANEETVEVGQIMCTLSNIKATVTVSDQIKQLDRLAEASLDPLYYTPMVVTVEMGGAAVDFSSDEERAIYFAAGDDPQDMTLTVNGMCNIAEQGEEPNYIRIEGVSLTIPCVKVGQWRRINLDVIGLSEGNVEFQFNVENWTYGDLIDVDITRSTPSLTAAL